MKVVMWLTILLAAAIAVVDLTYEPNNADVVYEMCNKKIEWTYAGK